VVVNDLSPGDVEKVVDEVRCAQGEAVAYPGNMGSWDVAHGLVDRAVAAYGRLDALIANAGVGRRGSLTEMSVTSWVEALDANVNATFFPAHAAIVHWRSRAEQGDDVDARLICTTSMSGLYGTPGLGAYDTAKAALVGFVRVAAVELEGSGVTVNAIAPRAQTPMAEELGIRRPENEHDRYRRSPQHITPLVAWLASSQSAAVSGRIFEVAYGRLGLVAHWRDGPTMIRGRRWEVNEIGSAMTELLAAAEPSAPIPFLRSGGRRGEAPR
jgi:NAD(P)-dependent dehydrogenase (short-subunit alcohol dehydrogenase family)